MRPYRSTRSTRPLAAAAAAGTMLLLAACSSTMGKTSDGGDGAKNPSASGSCSIYPAVRKAFDEAQSVSTTWTGPTTGPKAEGGKFIVYVSTDERNGGAHGVGQGVRQAAKAIGWRFQIIDGKGTVSDQAAALNQAIALRPDGIVLGSVDAAGQKDAIRRATAQGIKVVGWHSAAEPGPIADPKVFTNLSTDPAVIGRATSDWVIATSHCQAGVVILTDSQYKIAQLKADAMRKRVEECSECSMLETIEVPVADVSQRMPQLITSLVQRYKGKLTHVIGINDGYFDYTTSSLLAAGVGKDKIHFGGQDGTKAAFQRIAAGDYQQATIPEPLNLQGWQTVDELNRAFAGKKPSGFAPPGHVVVAANVHKAGGDSGTYDPPNGYRDHYRDIWGR
ncbi:sugar ABC transporter substrate-binding protein [Wenjunlia tyrosinilytica]|uniref:Sugar ABC transporter substrate-binding protein n=2 Tax=Wenjunlia tyrosinilytica TaxID=1544741 RepID=A0A917ZTF6_9ACTN|nr:sugar ABC transporter substrate-binding protein [Wenjunlia tyrosinilytica]